jgi:hypothetical protein
MNQDPTIQKALKVRKAVQRYFEANASVSELPCKDLMPWLIKEEIFEKDHRNGQPIRDLLRKLDEANLLNLMPQIRVERKQKNRNWFFQRSSKKVKKVMAQGKPNSPDIPKDVRSGSIQMKGDREKSDEAYVLDLCDKALKVQGLRQYRFDWLLGDEGKSGKKASLPVDIYYPDLKLVIEYRERQHTESVPIMDRRMTLSGISRGEQRRRYDERRRKEIPKHGLRLIEISFNDFDHDASKKIIRDLGQNSISIQEKLKDIL